MASIGRNDPCPCGSGKKYKKCCLNKPAPLSLSWRKMRQTEGDLIPLLLQYTKEDYGPGAIAEAWDEFTLWRHVPLDIEANPEVEAIFVYWLVFNWVPDNSERDDGERYPEEPVALHYLQHAGAGLDSWQRRFIQACCSQPYSFFMVTAADPGKSLSLRDLLLNSEVTVCERQASSRLHKGTIIFARVIRMDGTAIMMGVGSKAIPPSYLNMFIDIRESMEQSLARIGRDFLSDNDTELRTLYYEIIEHASNPPKQKLINTDGDPLQPTRIFYRLHCTPGEARDALISLSRAGGDSVTDSGDVDEQGELRAIHIPWIKQGNKMHKGWDNTVLGHLHIDADQLVVEVNSQPRAEVIKGKITRRLGKRAVFRHTVIESVEKALEDIRQGAPAKRTEPAQLDDERMNSHEVPAAVKEMAAQHWRDWLETPIPLLKGQTPRQAAGSARGRERLEALLMQYDRPDRPPRPFDPDFDALRRELGLS